jgi:hypothetical protein
MRTKRSRIRDTRTKVHIMSGGVKEDVAQIELRGGELIDCQNYQEVDGVYHGYSSIPGYEVFDGQTLPSNVPIEFITDYGNDNFTNLLIEGDSVNDKSKDVRAVTNTGVTTDSGFTSLLTSSLKFETNDYLSVAGSADLGPGDEDYAIDLWIRPTATNGVRSLIGKGTSFSFQILDGEFKLMISTDGVSYGLSYTFTGYTVPLNTWTHVELTHNEAHEWTLYVNGGVVGTTTGAPFTSASVLLVGMFGASPGFEGYMDSIRVSKGAIRHLFPFETPTLPYSSADYYTIQVNDVDREAQRALIGAVPGDDPVRGVHVMDGVVYAVRDFDTTTAKIYKSTNSGWQALTGTLSDGGKYRFTIGQFDELTGLQRQRVTYFVSGVDKPHYIDGDTIVPIDHVNLPDESTPDFYATFILEFKNRLFLGYPDGRLLFSAVGDPTNFDPLSGAGEIYMEDTITNLVVGPGDTMIIFCKGSTYLLKSLTDNSNAGGAVTSQYKFYMETFSKTSGSFEDTAQRIVGTIVNSGEKGVTSLEATDTFGDFSAAFVSKNIQVSYMRYKDLITTSTVQKANNQYRLFMSDGQAFYFTFDVEKKIKGVTKVKYLNPVLLCSEGVDENGDIMIVFASSNGFIYKMDSGTSFNGEDIVTRLTTAYDSYASPGSRKRFRSVNLEMKAGRDTLIYGSLSFDYGSPAWPKFSQEGFIAESPGGVWGVDRWGQFTYGSSTTQNPMLYSNGYGKNMSLSLTTSDRYREPHIINAAVIRYTIVGDVM